MIQLVDKPNRLRGPGQLDRAARFLIVPVFLAQLAFFTYIALHRFANGDEGFYLLASRLVLAHKKPYLDFFFLQMPLLPYVYASWMRLTQLSWTSARIFAALLTTILGTLLYAHICRLTRSWLAGLAGMLVFASTSLVFTSLPLITHYSLAGLLIFSAYVLVSNVPNASYTALAAAGLLFGLCVDTRSYLVLVGPLFVWWICHCSDRWLWLRSTLSFAAGFVVAMLFPLYFFLLSPGAFLFGNLGYHSLRSGSGLVGMWQQKLFTVLQALIGGPPGNGIQASLLLVISFAFIFSIARDKYVPRFALSLAVAIAVISLLPTPVYPQYFAYCFPFLVVATVCLLHDLLAELESASGKRLAAGGCLILLAIYLVAPVNDFRRYLITGEGVPGLERVKDKEDWRVERILEVSRAIDQLSRPGDSVISLWPGYLFQTHTLPLPRLESDFSLPIAAKVPPELRRRYHVLTIAELDDEIANHRTQLVVLGNENRVMQEAAKDSVANTLQSNGYKPIKSIGDTTIYMCCSRTVSQPDGGTP
jgi:Dolichyl-phosphate-mannose-protein mannosyltransferase